MTLSNSRKSLIGLILLLVLVGVYTRYGYLIASFRRLQPPQTSSPESPQTAAPSASQHPLLQYLTVPSGYKMNVFSTNVPGARSLALGDNGVVYVGTRKEGKIYALEDGDHDGVAENTYIIASGLNNPNGVTYLNGDLYVAEISRILKFSNIDKNFTSKPKYSVVYSALPDKPQHGWRYLRAGPDGKLYIGIGAPCNNCESTGAFASIARLNTDGTGFEIIANGIRNTVGFAWNTEDQKLWFTDNGRDNLGDNKPDDELNQLTNLGDNFGYPYCHAGDIADPQFGHKHPCTGYVAPALKLGAHVAALGMQFLGPNFPDSQLKHSLLIAEHGSWNSRTPVGYRIMAADIDGSHAGNYREFLTGWLTPAGSVHGRPVDIIIDNSHAILISDDYAGLIYRLVYSGM